MPRRRRRMGKRRGGRRGRAPSGRRGGLGGEMKLASPQIDLGKIFQNLSFLAQKQKDADMVLLQKLERKESKEWTRLDMEFNGEYKIESKEAKRESPELALLRGVFKRDTPYRTILNLQSNQSTTASGVVNQQFAWNGLLGTTAEWTAIDSLFNEFFVHAVRIDWFPYNHGGKPTGTHTGFDHQVNTTAGTVSQTTAGAIWVCSWGPPGYYSAAAGMGNNPSHKLVHTGERHFYTWRNNVRFDPHGISLAPLTSVGWQGWTQVPDVANIGGAIQLRTINDLVIGDGAGAVNLANCIIKFDVSFRVRS